MEKVGEHKEKPNTQNTTSTSARNYSRPQFQFLAANLQFVIIVSHSGFNAAHTLANECLEHQL